MWYLKVGEKKLIFLDISSTNTLPVNGKPQRRFFTCCLGHFRTSVSSSATFERPWENLSTQLESLYATNTSQHKHETFIYKYSLIDSLCPQKKTHNRTLLFGNILLIDGRHFYYWNQPLNMRIRVCYLDCHEAGLCFYLLIHIEILLRPLQLLYFHLWPVYWLCFIL
jgi:hypothetical protein